MEKQDIGVIGLGLMGKNLSLNMESRGFSVSLYNRSFEKTEEFLAEADGKHFTGAKSLQEFAQSLERPRKILLIVKAGASVDEVIGSLVPYLEKGDILIDGGNAYFEDTIRRHAALKEQGIHFMDISFSGGEKGALEGPAIMPAGDREAYNQVEPFLAAISAKVEGKPGFAYLGPAGAGHYVKMVHNGIEYSDMQLISEAYFILKQGFGLSAEELHEIFTEWNKGELNSYLIEITADIFTKTDPETEEWLLDVIEDAAAQKGTGKWASQNALDLGVPLSIITESVFARIMSSLKEERIYASKKLQGPARKAAIKDKDNLIEAVRKALYLSKIMAYTQGFAQLKAASASYGWNLPYGEIAFTFRGGCIIRAQFLAEITKAYRQNPDITNLLLEPYFNGVAGKYQSALREILAMAIQSGIPVPAFSSALAYFDSYRTETLPANLLQAQRDYFGAHTYRRTDREGVFHTDWSK